MAGKEGKESKAPEAAAPAAEAAPKKKGPMKAVIVAVAVVVLEAATVGVTMMMAGGPKTVVAAQPTTAPKAVVEKDVEVKIISKEQLPSSKEGHLVLYDLQVVAKVSEKNKEKVTELIAERDAEIKDRIRTIVASSEPAAMKEPGLETLRRQIMYQLEHDLGKDLIKELLIPRCTPIRDN